MDSAPFSRSLTLTSPAKFLLPCKVTLTGPRVRVWHLHGGGRWHYFACQPWAELRAGPASPAQLRASVAGLWQVHTGVSCPRLRRAIRRSSLPAQQSEALQSIKLSFNQFLLITPLERYETPCRRIHSDFIDDKLNCFIFPDCLQHSRLLISGS